MFRVVLCDYAMQVLLGQLYGPILGLRAFFMMREGQYVKILGQEFAEGAFLKVKW